MSHRYNTIDILIGVGMCAIVLRALLFFFSANGTYQAVKWVYRMADEGMRRKDSRDSHASE